MDATIQRRTRAVSFGAGADIYERARPTYPDAAVDWLVPAGTPRGGGLGAGPGPQPRSASASRMASRHSSSTAWRWP